MGGMAPKTGLRERKRRSTMRRIQEVALDLFDDRGFENVTIEQIADAAEVSPSTVYRYFGTKEQVVLRDEFDVQFFEAVEAELRSHPPAEAVRRAVAKILAEFFQRDDDLVLRRTAYTYEEPALRAAALAQTEDFARGVVEALSRAARRPRDDLEVQVVAAALVWSLDAAVRHWHAGGYTTSLEDEIDVALGVVGGGLQLT
jgi:AcrR family transcriptional regulator